MAPGSDSTFCLADISVGDHYVVEKKGVVTNGRIGGVNRHNGSSTYVITSTTGEEVCLIRKGSPKIVRGSTIIIPIGKCDVFSFEPAYTLSS